MLLPAKTLLLAGLALVGSLAPAAARASGGSILELEAAGANGDLVLAAGYREHADALLVDQELQVELQGAAALTKFDLMLKRHGRQAVIAGHLVTDEQGRGRFEARIDDVQPGPDGRPPAGRRIDAGDGIALVDPETGAFVAALFQIRS